MCKGNENLPRYRALYFDAETRTCSFTEDGITKIEDLFDIDNLYDLEHQTLYHYMIQALRANVAFQLDVDYIVEDEKSCSLIFSQDVLWMAR